MRALIIMALVLTIAHRADAQGKPQQPKHDTTATVARKRPWYDTTKALPRDTAWVASRKGHTYYLDGCRGALTLTPKNVIHFPTEAQAKASGFTRSKQWGC